MIPYRCTYCGQIRTDTADGWSYHRATTANHRGPARYSNDPSRPSIIDAAQDTERQRAHDRTARGEAARRTARAQRAGFTSYADERAHVGPPSEHIEPAWNEVGGVF